MIVRALIALALAGTAQAGVVYRYTTDVSGNPLLRHASGRVWVDGERSRTELEPEPEPRAADVILVSDGKTRLLNLGNQTWYSEPEPGFPDLRTGARVRVRVRARLVPHSPMILIITRLSRRPSNSP